MGIMNLNNEGVDNVIEHIKFKITNYNAILPRVEDYITIDYKYIEISLNLSDVEKKCILDALSGTLDYRAVSSAILPIVIFFKNREFRQKSSIKMNINGNEQIISKSLSDDFYFPGDSIIVEYNSILNMVLAVKFYGRKVDTYYHPQVLNDYIFLKVDQYERLGYQFIPLSGGTPVIPGNLKSVKYYYFKEEKVEVDDFGSPKKYRMEKFQNVFDPFLNDIEKYLKESRYSEELAYRFKKFYIANNDRFDLFDLFRLLNLSKYPYLRYMVNFIRNHYETKNYSFRFDNFVYYFDTYSKKGDALDSIYDYNGYSMLLMLNTGFYTHSIRLRDLKYISPSKSIELKNEEKVYYVDSSEYVLLKDFVEEFVDDDITLRKTNGSVIQNNRERIDMGMPFSALKDIAMKEDFMKYALVLVNGQIMKEKIVDGMKTVSGKDLTPNPIAFMNNPKRYALVTPLTWYFLSGGVVPDVIFDARLLIEGIKMGVRCC